MKATLAMLGLVFTSSVVFADLESGNAALGLPQHLKNTELVNNINGTWVVDKLYAGKTSCRGYPHDLGIGAGFNSLSGQLTFLTVMVYFEDGFERQPFVASKYPAANPENEILIDGNSVVATIRYMDMGYFKTISHLRLTLDRSDEQVPRLIYGPEYPLEFNNRNGDPCVYVKKDSAYAKKHGFTGKPKTVPFSEKW